MNFRWKWCIFPNTLASIQKLSLSMFSVTKTSRSVTPFWFQLLTMVSSFIGTHYEHRQLLVFHTVNTQITVVTLITCYTDLSTLKHDTHSSLQTFISLKCTLPIFRLSFRLWVFDVIECLDNFICFSLSSWTSPFQKRSVSFCSVSLPRIVCAFVSLRHALNSIKQNKKRSLYMLCL